MLSKTITYTDFNGRTRTETFEFHLYQHERVKWASDKDGLLRYKKDLSDADLEGIQKAAITDEAEAERMLNVLLNDGTIFTIVNVIEDLVRRSYGQRSEDGRRFVKSKEMTEEFMQTEAYSVLFEELTTNPDAGSAFMNALMAKNDTQNTPPAHRRAEY